MLTAPRYGLDDSKMTLVWLELGSCSQHEGGMYTALASDERLTLVGSMSMRKEEA
jgi:hypothetical protein